MAHVNSRMKSIKTFNKFKTFNTSNSLILVCFLVLLHGAYAQEQQPHKKIAPIAGLDAVRTELKSNSQVNVIVTLKTGTTSAASETSFPASVILPDRSIPLMRTPNMALAAQRVNALLSSHSITAGSDIKHFPIIITSVNQQELDALSQSPDVAGIQLNRRNKLLLNSSTINLRANQVWNFGQTGSDWAVAVLDTGVEATHPFLAGKVIREACFSTNNNLANNVNSLFGLDPVESSLCPNGQAEQIGTGASAPMCNFEGCEHGTHVAGIAAGRDDSKNLKGVAHGSNIISIQVFTRSDDAEFCEGEALAPCIYTYDGDVIAGLDHVYDLATNAQNPLKIAAVNLSLGAGEYDSEASCLAENDAYATAADALSQAGIAVVAASGNEGHTTLMTAPACLPGIISVGSINDSDNSISFFSNETSFLDIYAPGALIESSVLNGQYASIDGTSMAAPHVSGCFALMRAQCPAENYADHFNLMKSFSPTVTQFLGDVKPRLNCAAAFKQLACTDGVFDIPLSRRSSLLPLIVPLLDL